MDAVGVHKGVDVARGKQFPPEFHQEAVRLYRVSGRTLRAVSAELSISTETLRLYEGG